MLCAVILQTVSGDSLNYTINICPSYSCAFDVIAKTTDEDNVSNSSSSVVNQSDIMSAPTFLEGGEQRQYEYFQIGRG